MPVAIAHVAILLTSFAGLATAGLTFAQQFRVRRQVTEIQILVNGERERTERRVEDLTAALTAAGIVVPASPRPKP